MGEIEQMGRCRSEVDECRGSPSELKIADAIDRIAADVASIKAKVDAVSPEDVKHFVESEKAWVKLVEEQRDAAIRERDEARAEAQRIQDEADDQEQTDKVKRLNAEIDKMHDTLMNRTWERDEARAEVERLRAELEQRQPAGNSPEIPDSSPAAPQPAAPAAGWLTEREQHALRHILASDVEPVIRSILARAGSPPVVEVPELGFLGPMTGREQGIVLAYRDALDKAGIAWKEVGRE